MSRKAVYSATHTSAVCPRGGRRLGQVRGDIPSQPPRTSSHSQPCEVRGETEQKEFSCDASWKGTEERCLAEPPFKERRKPGGLCGEQKILEWGPSCFPPTLHRGSISDTMTVLVLTGRGRLHYLPSTLPFHLCLPSSDPILLVPGRSPLPKHTPQDYCLGTQTAHSSSNPYPPTPMTGPLQPKESPLSPTLALLPGTRH